MAGHTEGSVLNKFCAKRTKKCKDKQEYQKNCTPKPTGWKDDFFWQGSEYVDGTSTVQKKIFEAHHLLCVAVVTECIVGGWRIKEIVANTVWCINKPKNMFAMPLWGHTIKHYCTIQSRIFFEADTPYYKGQGNAPKFKNIPMHDSEHGKYIDEVKSELRKIAREVRESKKKHENKVKELKKKLNNLSETFRTKLQTRGKRSGGTHKAWINAVNGKTKGWYKPFSMANSPRHRSFPGMTRKIMARAISYLYRPT